MTTLTRPSHLTLPRFRVNSDWYRTLLQKAQSMYFGVTAMSILIGSIIGAIALENIFKNNAPTWQLVICVLSVVGNLVTDILEQGIKQILAFFMACTFLNAIFILINLS